MTEVLKFCVCSAASVCPTLCDPISVVYQAPLSMGFSGNNTGVGCHFPFQGIFLTQGLNPRLLRLLYLLESSLPQHQLGNLLSLYFDLINLKSKDMARRTKSSL